MAQRVAGNSENPTQLRSFYGVEISLLLIFFTLSLALLGALMVVFSDQIPEQNDFRRQVMLTLGSFLMAGCTGNLLYRFTFREYFQRRQYERLTVLFRSELARLVPRVVVYGLANIEDRMIYGDLFDSLQSGDELWWLDTYAPGHQSWRGSLQNAIDRGAKINMLILEPNCNIAKLRAKEIASEFFSADTFHTDLKQFYNDMAARARSSKGQSIEVRTYSDLIGCPIYLIVRNGRAFKAFSSLYLSPASFDFPHFVWEDSQQRQILDSFEKYVKRKWDSIKVPTSPDK